MALTTVHNAITTDATSAGTVVSGVTNIIVQGITVGSGTIVVVLFEDVPIGQLDTEGVKTVFLGSGGTVKLQATGLTGSGNTVTAKIVDQT